MPRGRKKAKVVAEPSRKRERNQSALRKPDEDVSLQNPMIMFKTWCYRHCNRERFLTKLRSSKKTRLQQRLIGGLQGLLPKPPKVIRPRPFSQQHILTVVSNPLLSPNKPLLAAGSLQTEETQASNLVKSGSTLAATTLQQRLILTLERELAAGRRKLLGLLSRPHKLLDQVISVVLPVFRLARPLDQEHAKTKVGIKVPKLS